MNLQEFAALKAGDKIRNPWTESEGEVAEATDSGVRVVWGQRGPAETPFFYSVAGTAWLGWSKVDSST